jgi:uncharacterized protein (DUF2147 family)
MPGNAGPIRIFTVSVAIVLLTSTAAIAADPTGTWYTAANRAQVRIGHCAGSSLCGGIVTLKEPNDPQTGKPKTDVNNSDQAKRNRPLIGVRIVLDLKPTGTPDQWQGEVYNADDGRTYRGYLTMTGANTLELKGCVLGGLICKFETWTRAR